MRGCFLDSAVPVQEEVVLPAYAGMFPRAEVEKRIAERSPRVCGDVSSYTAWSCRCRRFSPRMRGCFRISGNHSEATPVLPAYAGMFRVATVSCAACSGSPRVCGDVSSHVVLPPIERGVLPAYAGMFPTRPLHTFCVLSSPRVCGDVSESLATF